MKELSLKKNFAQCGSSARPKFREPTVIKHHHTSPIRQTVGSFPKVRYVSALPEGNKYLNLHPVFKFVDNFLTAASTNCAKPNVVPHSCGVSNKRKNTLRCGNGSSKPHVCDCMPSGGGQYFMGDSVPKQFVTKKSNMQPCQTNQTVTTFAPDRAQANISNINSKNDIRVSLRNPHYHSCVVPKPMDCQQGNHMGCGQQATHPLGGCQQPTHPVGYCQQTMGGSSKTCLKMGLDCIPVECSDYYVEQLKQEIRQNQAKICNSQTPPDDDYVNKLKQELACRRNRCLKDATNIINELQDEILTYRMQAKTKYSSSCSDIGSADKALGSCARLMAERSPLETKQIGESPPSSRTPMKSSVKEKFASNVGTSKFTTTG